MIDGKFTKTSELVNPKDSWINLELGTWVGMSQHYSLLHSGFTGNRFYKYHYKNDMRQLAKMRISTWVKNLGILQI